MQSWVVVSECVVTRTLPTLQCSTLHKEMTVMLMVCVSCKAIAFMVLPCSRSTMFQPWAHGWDDGKKKHLFSVVSFARVHYSCPHHPIDKH
jgi:hypothetical protein